jgi:hypothetical protein
MAGETIRELLVSIGIEADEGQLANIDKAIGQIKDGLSNLADVATKAAAAVAAFAAAAVYQAVATANAAGEIRDQADALGLTTDAYQELLYAVQHVGGEASDLSAMMAKLTVAGQNAADGNKTLADTFGKLGITLAQVKGSKPADLLERLAEGLATTTDPAERLASAPALLGDDIAKKMIPLLGKGSDELEALAKQARELGAVMGEDDLEAADAFSDQVEQLGAMLSALRNQIGLALIPALSEIATRLIGWYKANREVISQKIEVYAGKVADAFTAVADAVGKANDLVGGVDGWLKLGAILGSLTAASGLLYVAFQVGMVIMGIVDLVAAAAAFVGGGWALVAVIAVIAGALAQVAIVVGAFASTLLVFGDWITYLQGGDSVFGRLIDKWKTSEGLLRSLARFVEAYGQIWKAVFGLLEAGWDGFVAAIQPAIQWSEALGRSMTTYVIGALDALAPLLDMAAAGLAGIAGALSSDFAKRLATQAGTVAGIIGRVILGIVTLVASAGAAVFSVGALFFAAVDAVANAIASVAAYAGSAVAALVRIVDTFYGYLQSGVRAWDQMIERWRAAPGFLGAIGTALAAFGATGRAVLGLVSGYVADFVATLQEGVPWAMALGRAIDDYIGAAIERVASLLALLKLPDLTGTGTAAGLAAAPAGSIAALAPSPTYTDQPQSSGARTAAAGFAPRGGTSTSGTGAGAVNVGGDTITISGVGITMEEALELIARKAAEKSRMTAAAFRSAEV